MRVLYAPGGQRFRLRSRRVSGRIASAGVARPALVVHVPSALGFTIPCTINGEVYQYHLDFIAVLDDGRGLLDPLNVISEVTGEKKREKAAKVMTARTLWVPAVNNHGAFGRWGFIEIADPWDAESTIRGAIPAWATTDKDANKRF
jgi:hypothetical protein